MRQEESNSYSFDEAFVARLRSEHDAVLAAHLDSIGGLDALTGKTFGERHVGYFPPLTGLCVHSDVVAHPIACQIMDALLGSDFRCSFVHTNTAFPGSGLQPIHRDTGSLFGTECAVAHPVAIMVVNVPLCEFHEGNGSTEVWPGTHHVPDGPEDNPGDIGPRAQAFPSIRTNLPVGSLVLRDLRVWHRGMPNRSERHRTMLAIVYQRSWMDERRVSIPESTWNAWSAKARHIFRHNHVVPDAQHRPRTWDN
ncbi:MAG: phytanoyl-CoA dioxygenase family protein [Armatimonadota bacterium]